jgi:hypothetical protein
VSPLSVVVPVGPDDPDAPDVPEGPESPEPPVRPDGPDPPAGPEGPLRPLAPLGPETPAAPSPPGTPTLTTRDQFAAIESVPVLALILMFTVVGLASVTGVVFVHVVPLLNWQFMTDAPFQTAKFVCFVSVPLVIVIVRLLRTVPAGSVITRKEPFVETVRCS